MSDWEDNIEQEKPNVEEATKPKTPSVVIKKPVPKEEPRRQTGGKQVPVVPAPEAKPVHPPVGGKAPRAYSITQPPVPEPPFVPKRDSDSEEEEEEEENDDEGEEEQEDALIEKAKPKPHKEEEKKNVKKDVAPSSKKTSSKETKMSESATTTTDATTPAKKKTGVTASKNYTPKLVAISWEGLPEGEDATLPVYEKSSSSKRSLASKHEMPNNLSDPIEHIELMDRMPVALANDGSHLRVFPQFLVAICTHNWRKPQSYWDKTEMKDGQLDIQSVSVFGSARTALTIEHMIKVLKQSAIIKQPKTALVLKWVESLKDISKVTFEDIPQGKGDDQKKLYNAYKNCYTKMTGPVNPKDEDEDSPPAKKKSKRVDSLETIDKNDPEERRYLKEKERERLREIERRERKHSGKHASKSRKTEHVSSKGHEHRRGRDEDSESEESEDEDFVASDDEEPLPKSKPSRKDKIFVDNSDSDDESEDEKEKIHFTKTTGYIIKNWASLDTARKTYIAKRVDQTAAELKESIRSADKKKRRHSEVASTSNGHSAKKKAKR